MEDRQFAADALDMAKHEVTGYARAATESSDRRLRDTFVRFCQEALQEQWDLYQLAEGRGWYPTPPQASPAEVQRIRGYFQQAIAQPAGRL